MSNPTCPQCELEMADEFLEADVYACACEAMIFVRPYQEWFVRWSAVLEGARKIAAADPTIIGRIDAITRSNEN